MLRTTSSETEAQTLTATAGTAVQKSVETPDTVLSPSRPERRFDAKTVEAAVALAARMQAEHQESLSEQELEAIAAEAGIRPEFMRRALSVVAEETTTVPVAPVKAATSVKSRRVTGSKRLTVRQKQLIFGLPLLYAILASVPLYLAGKMQNQSNSPGTALLILFSVVLPGILAIVLGANLGRKRQGAVAGALTGFSIMASLALVAIAANPENLGRDFGILVFFLLWTLGGASLGFVSAWAKQSMPHWLGAEPAEILDEDG